MTALSLGDAPVGEPGGETVMTPGVYLPTPAIQGQTNSGGEDTRGHEEKRSETS